MRKIYLSTASTTFILAVSVGLCVTTELPAQVIVVPNALATTDGNSFQTTPGGPTLTVRDMQICDASQFGTLSGPSFITQFAYRPDKTPGPSGPRSPTLRIFASTTSRSVSGPSPNLDENLGPDNMLVFSGTLNWETANLPGPGDTRKFDVLFPFSTPFRYDPEAGNLLLDIQISESDGPAIRFDAVTGDPMIASFGTPKVIEFTFEPAPLITIRVSQVEVCWNSKSNLTYQVQYRSALAQSVWTSFGDCVRATGPTSCFYDPVVVSQPQRFYRVAPTNCFRNSPQFGSRRNANRKPCSADDGGAPIQEIF